MRQYIRRVLPGLIVNQHISSISDLTLQMEEAYFEDTQHLIPTYKVKLQMGEEEIRVAAGPLHSDMFLIVKMKQDVNSKEILSNSFTVVYAIESPNWRRLIGECEG